MARDTIHGINAIDGYRYSRESSFTHDVIEYVPDFQELLDGRKRCFRFNVLDNGGVVVGDALRISEWDNDRPVTNVIDDWGRTGRECRAKVTHIQVGRGERGEVWLSIDVTARTGG